VTSGGMCYLGMQNTLSNGPCAPTMPNDFLRDLFEWSFDRFLANEAENIANGVSERNLCGRLALCLEQFKAPYGYGAYYADVEYNRNQGRVKTILDDKMQVVPVTCDLILHSRGEIPDRDNLIAIEMKKVGARAEEEHQDRVRLRALTKRSYDDIWSFDGVTLPEHVCGYALGFFIIINPKDRCFKIEMFAKGEFIRDWFGRF
jgi:hypothetical protein